MSWLSKALKNDTLRIGLTVAGAALAGKYVFGDYDMYRAVDPKTGLDTAKYAYTGTDISSRALNFLGVKPFGATAVGQFVSPVTDFVKSLNLGTGKSLADLISGFGKAPKAAKVSPTAIRTDTNFMNSQAQMIPVGGNGRVGGMLAQDAVQQYLARRGRIFGMPQSKTAQATISIAGSGSLAPTTASKKLARSRLVD
jgi:hypothetical protein